MFSVGVGWKENVKSLFHKHLFEKLFMTTYNIAVVTASKQTCGNFEVRCPHLFGILLQRRLQASIKCISLGSGSIGFFSIELDRNIRSIYGAYTEHIRAYTCIYGAFFPYTEHIRSIYGAYTCIYGAFFPYTEHIRGIFLHIRSIYGAFLPYTEHIRGIFLHIWSIYGAFFCIYGAYTGHVFAYTCIYGAFFPYTEHIRDIFSRYGTYTGHIRTYTVCSWKI